jgi:hypothetical protein
MMNRKVTRGMYDKYIISVEEIVLYEIMADSKEDAEERFANGEGDFIGYEEGERTYSVERVKDDAPR